MFVKFLLFSRFPETQNILVQRWPPSTTFRKNSFVSRERRSWRGDHGGEKRGYGGVLRLHQQCSWFCLLFCPDDSIEYVYTCLNTKYKSQMKRWDTLYTFATLFATGPGEILPQEKKGNLTFILQTTAQVYVLSVDMSIYSKCHIIHFIFTDPKEPLVPPRFIERFSNRKVKQGTSITLSVKVEGALLHFSR